MSDMNTESAHHSADGALNSVDASKREALRKLILGAAFVAPIVLSFAVDGLVSSALATPSCSNLAFSGRCLTPP